MWGVENADSVEPTLSSVLALKLKELLKGLSEISTSFWRSSESRETLVVMVTGALLVKISSSSDNAEDSCAM